MTVSDSLTRLLRQAIAWGAIYLLALPVYVVRGLVRSVADIRRFQPLRSGTVTCPHCGAANALDILATCRTCGATEFGSRLYCSHCREVTRAFPCDSCTAHIVV